MRKSLDLFDHLAGAGEGSRPSARAVFRLITYMLPEISDPVVQAHAQNQLSVRPFQVRTASADKAAVRFRLQRPPTGLKLKQWVEPSRTFEPVKYDAQH